MKNNEVVGGLLMAVLLLLQLGTWIGSGYLLWIKIEVNSFSKGVVWLLLWPILSGITQYIVTALFGLIVFGLDNLYEDFNKNREQKTSSYALDQTHLPIPETSYEPVKYSLESELSNPSLWSMHGRMRRITYLLLLILGVFVWGPLHLNGVEIFTRWALTNDTDMINWMLLSLVVDFLPANFIIFLGVKRLHDCNYKGWWLLIPFVSIVILFVPGTRGSNRFGPNPRIKNSYLNSDDKYEKDYSFLYIVAIGLFLTTIAIYHSLNMIEKAHQQKTIRPSQSLAGPIHLQLRVENHQLSVALLNRLSPVGWYFPPTMRVVITQHRYLSQLLLQLPLSFYQHLK